MRLWKVLQYLRDRAIELEGKGFVALLETLPPQWIEEALEATGTASIRRRRLPAELVIWVVIGMALFRQLSIEHVVDHLDLKLGEKKRLSKGALAPARRRVGSEPVEYLFDRTAQKWGHESADRDRWRGLALYGLDGTTLRVPDTVENLEAFGRSTTKRGQSAYPLVRLVVLMALRSHVLVGARFGAYAQSEHRLAVELWGEIPDHSLTIVDRNFLAAEILWSLTVGGKHRHWLLRAKSNTRWKTLEQLGPNDFLVELRVSGEARRKNPALPKVLRARAIRYQRSGFKPQTLLTSLLDSERFPASELIDLYHERWELEVGYDEVKTHLLEREEALRSKAPGGIHQEIWGILLAYNMVRVEMERAAGEANIPPLRLSFVGALRIIRQAWWVFATLDYPGAIPKHLRRMRDDIKREMLPPRRPERSYPRAVKIKMSNYPKKQPMVLN